MTEVSLTVEDVKNIVFRTFSHYTNLYLLRAHFNTCVSETVRVEAIEDFLRMFETQAIKLFTDAKIGNIDFTVSEIVNSIREVLIANAKSQSFH